MLLFLGFLFWLSHSLLLFSLVSTNFYIIFLFFFFFFMCVFSFVVVVIFWDSYFYYFALCSGLNSSQCVIITTKGIVTFSQWLHHSHGYYALSSHYDHHYFFTLRMTLRQYNHIFTVRCYNLISPQMLLLQT